MILLHSREMLRWTKKSALLISKVLLHLIWRGNHTESCPSFVLESWFLDKNEMKQVQTSPSFLYCNLQGRQGLYNLGKTGVFFSLDVLKLDQSVIFYDAEPSCFWPWVASVIRPKEDRSLHRLVIPYILYGKPKCDTDFAHSPLLGRPTALQTGSSNKNQHKYFSWYPKC